MKARTKSKLGIVMALPAALYASAPRADILLDGVNVGASFTTSGDLTSAAPGFLVNVDNTNGGATSFIVSTGDTLRDNNSTTFLIGAGATLGTLDNRGTILGNIFNAVNLSSVGPAAITTFLNSGTIEGQVNGNASVILRGTIGALGNTGTISHTGASTALIINSATTITNDGAIQSGTGHGVLVGFTGIAAIGSFTNNGTIVTSGAAGVEAVQLGDGADADVVTSFTNNGTIRNTGAGAALAVNSNATITNGIANTGMIDGAVSLATATLNLNGTSGRVTGAVTGGAGSTVNVNGTFSSEGSFNVGAFNIAGGGVFSMGHTVTATALTNAGTLSVATGTTSTIAGNFVQSAGGTYRVGADAAGQSGRIDATGTATLSGGTVAVMAASGAYAPATTYTILSASGGVTGTFAGATSNLAFLMPTLSYDASNVYLTLARNSVSFASAGQTANQRATGSAVDALGSGPVHDAVALLSATQAAAALDALSGEIHASGRSAIFDGARLARLALTSRLRQSQADAAPAGTAAAFAPAVPIQLASTADIALAAAPQGGAGAGTRASRGVTVWTQAMGSWGETGSDGNAAGVERSTGGFLIGADLAIGEHWRAGVAGGYSRTDFDTDARASSGSVDNYLVAGYGGAQFDAIGIRFGAVHGWHDFDTSRSVEFPGYAEAVTARYDARSWHAFGEAGYSLRIDDVAVEPFVALDYLRLETDGFTEQGNTSGAALTAQSSTDDTLASTVGVRAAVPVALGGGLQMTVSGTAGWRHAYGDVTPDTAFVFQSDPSASFSTSGAPIARDAAVVEVGVGLDLTNSISADIGYAGQIAQDARDHSVVGTIRIRF